MKRTLLFLLLITLLLSSFPFTVSATQAPPIKDESEKVTPTEQSEEGATLTGYDMLYIGADGSVTASGGTLVALYTAYGADGSVLLSDGKWQNKMDATGETDALLVGGDAFWKKNAQGGIGYDMTMAEWQANGSKVGLTLPDSFASLYSFSVETVSSIKGIRSTEGILEASAAGITADQHRSSFRLELMSCAFFAGADPTNESQSFCGRWLFSRKSPIKNGWGGAEFSIKYLADDTWKVHGSATPKVLGTSYTKQTAKDGVAYTIAYHGGASIAMQMGGGYYGPAAYFVKKADYTRLTSTSYDDRAPIFSLFNGVPADVYAIRVYSMPLTEAEKAHNFFIDLLAMTQMPLDDYLALSSTERALLESALSTLSLSSTPAEVAAAFKEATALFPDRVDPDELLYVADGLTGLFVSLPHFSTGHMIGETSTTWFNGMGGDSATLVGEGWFQSKRGGLSIVKSLEEFNQSSEFGVVLPGSLLPEKDFTVELVANPTGITKENADGSLSHYVDERPTTESTGIWREYGFGIGPLRALQACSLRPVGIDASLERRWVYNATGGCQALGWKYRRSEMNWSRLAFEEITTLSITYEFIEKKSNYALYSDHEKLFEIPISESEYKSPDESGRMFRLMCSVAGTVFSVRVYDRALTEAELARNHVADLIYYYDLDAEVLLQLMETAKGADLFSPYKAMGFEMTREAAQAEFNRLTVGIWLSYEGVGICGKDKDALRYYFGMNQASVDGMLAAGFDIELGVLANVGGNTLPLLAGGAYDYKIPTFTADSGRIAGFFIDEDSFALTLLYENLEKTVALTSVLTRGYVRLVSPDGEEMVFYLDLPESKYDATSLFNVCYGMKKTGITAGTSAAALVNKTVEYSVAQTNVYVQAGVAAGGDGSQAAPFRSFAEGWYKCKELLAKCAEPTKINLILGDGEYGIYETLRLTAEDMPYAYSALEVMSENGKSVLTTTVSMAADGFTEEKDNLWVCQLEKENGVYPAFRYLYVDGERAEISHATGESDDDADIQVMGFDRSYDGIYDRVRKLYEAGELTAASTGGYPAGRDDLEAKFNAYKEAFLSAASEEELPIADPIGESKAYFPLTAVHRHGTSGKVTGLSVEAYMAMQWYFNIVRVETIDYDDTAIDAEGRTHVACYFDPDEYEHFWIQSNHLNEGRYCCFFNHPLYLDEEGEMYYDRETGKVYYYTEEDMTKKIVARPTLDVMLELDGAHDVSFTELTFTGVDDFYMSEHPTCHRLGGLDALTDDIEPFPIDRAALRLYDTRDIQLYGCIFTELSAKAIHAEGRVNGLSIEYCAFTNLGSSGFYYGDGKVSWDNETRGIDHVTVTDNYFSGIGQTYRNATAVFFTLAKDVSITHNTILDCAYTAISIGFGYSAKASRPSDNTFYNIYNVDVSYNYITDYMTELGDGAAIYFAGGNSDADDDRYFNSVHHNYIVMSNRTGNGRGHMVVGIYFDGATSNFHCHANVIAEQSYGAFVGENDNLFMDGDPYTVELRRRAAASEYIYLQYIKGQEVQNILCSGNIILNVRASDTKPLEQQYEVYKDRIVADRKLTEENTVYVNGVNRIPASAEDIAYGAGGYDVYGDPSYLSGNDY